MSTATRCLGALSLLLMIASAAAAQNRPNRLPGDECPDLLGQQLDPACRIKVKPDPPGNDSYVKVEVADPRRIRNRRRPPPNVLEYRIETAPGHRVPLLHISGQVLMYLQRNTAGIRVHEFVDTVSNTTWASSCVGATCGWINGVYLRPSRMNTGAEQGETYTVTGVAYGNYLAIYAQPSLSAAMVGRIPSGANDVVYLGRTWRDGNFLFALVSWRGVRGWSVAHYLRR